jgi:uncharacterized protein YecE (DUF72 family)
LSGSNISPYNSNHPCFYIGTSGWTYDHWKGCFYPVDLPKKRWFDYYASLFNAVEVNATYYRTFKDETFHGWKERTPTGFGFVLKAPKLITHRKFLVDVEQDIQDFYRSCTQLEEKFEMILLQVAPNMPCDLGRLQKALQAFPDPTRVAVEFRRAEWLSQDTLNILRGIGATLCLVDSPRQALMKTLTSTSAYIRLHGRKHWYSHNYSAEELGEVASLVSELTRRGVKRVYIFFNNDFDGHAPANAISLSKLLSPP